MKWCCDGFRAHYEQRHERGLFVYVLPPTFPKVSTEPSFHIGMRALERSKFGELQEATKGRMGGCMSLSGGAGMSYCPWCGAAVAKFYRRSWQELLDERITDEFRILRAQQECDAPNERHAPQVAIRVSGDAAHR
jgi:hypothetical protein